MSGSKKFWNVLLSGLPTATAKIFLAISTSHRLEHLDQQRLGLQLHRICSRANLAGGTREQSAAPHCRPKLRAGLKNLNRDDKWSFCLTAGTLCPANQEKQ